MKAQWLLLLGMSVVSGMSGCKNGADMHAWFDATGLLKANAVENSAVLPYRLPQHQALKGYFSQLGGMALSLKDDGKLRGRFDKAFEKSNPTEVCGSILIERSLWSEMLRNCTKNEFFVCAEEVRAYPEMVLALREALSPGQRKRFDETEACRVD